MKYQYQITKEIWKTNRINDAYIDGLTADSFFEYAHENRNGCEFSETVWAGNSLDDAKIALKKYKCTCDFDFSYGAEFEVYDLEKIIYDDDGDISDYEFIQSAEIDDWNLK